MDIQELIQLLTEDGKKEALNFLFDQKHFTENGFYVHENFSMPVIDDEAESQAFQGMITNFGLDSLTAIALGSGWNPDSKDFINTEGFEEYERKNYLQAQKNKPEEDSQQGA